MFTIICTLPDSFFTNQTEEVETETDWGFERVVPVYGKPGLMVYPKAAWKRAADLALPGPTVQKYPGNETH